MDKRKYLEDEEMQAVSMTECTGLMPSLPQDDSEDEYSAELYAILPAKKDAQKHP